MVERRLKVLDERELVAPVTKDSFEITTRGQAYLRGEMGVLDAGLRVPALLKSSETDTKDVLNTEGGCSTPLAFDSVQILWDSR